MIRDSGKLLLKYIYPLAYAANRAVALLPGPAGPLPELVVVIPGRARGWILERISREIAAQVEGEVVFHAGVDALPAAGAYFFPHYSLYVHALKLNPVLWRGRRYVFYTHPSDIGVFRGDELFAMNHATRVIPMCQRYAQFLRDTGIAPDRLAPVLGGGADPEIFRGHERGSGVVGLCSAFSERKNPELVLEVVKSLPHRKFLLVGTGWREFRGFGELDGLPNFEYVETDYDQYPGLYSRMDVFLSPSSLEGGPIPLIEAMMCNAVPVSNDVGFAPELITPGSNGYIFSPDATAGEVCAMIEEAFDNRVDVRSSVERYTWRRFAREMCSIMELESVSQGQ